MPSILKMPVPSQKKFLILVVFVYFSAGMLFLYFYRFQINPDGISYISLAQKYVSGDYAHAVNAYWSPLLVWMSIPFYLIGLNDIIAMKICLLFSGIVVFIGVHSLWRCFTISDEIKRAIFISLIPLVLYGLLYVISPDMLSAGILCWYWGILFNARYLEKLSYGTACGILGALGYFSKAYIFYFFAVHFLTINILFFYMNNDIAHRKSIARNFIAGILSFLIISGCWIFVLSAKYGGITVSTAGAYNLAEFAPDSPGIPIKYGGLMAPSNATALSAWEDPSYHIFTPWNPFASWHDLLYFARHFCVNCLVAIRKLAFAWCCIFVLASCIFVQRKKIQWPLTHSFIMYCAITIFIYIAGYCFVRVLSRYLWGIYFLIMIVCGCLLTVLYQHVQINKLSRRLIILMFSAGFTIIPAYRLINKINTGKEVSILANQLKDASITQGTIAADSRYNTALSLCFFSGNAFYGIPQKNTGLETQLKDHAIDYFLSFGNETDTEHFLSTLHSISLNEGKEHIRIFFLKK